jgi:hypothetical protein
MNRPSEALDPHQAGLAGESERLIMALRLGDAEDTVIPGVVHGDLLTVLDRQPPCIAKHGVAKGVLRAYGTRSSETGRPPLVAAPRRAIADVAIASVVVIRAGSRIRDVRSELCADCVELRLSSLLNMSPTMVIPGDLCDMPPKSAWLNCAIRPPPDRSARSTVRTASAETECLMARRVIKASSVTSSVLPMAIAFSGWPTWPSRSLRRRTCRGRFERHDSRTLPRTASWTSGT